MNIAGVVIRSRPEDQAELERAFLAAGLGEIHFRDDQGRLVVTIEGAEPEEQMAKLRAIQDLPFVLAANLSCAYSLDDPAGDEPTPPATPRRDAAAPTRTRRF